MKDNIMVSVLCTAYNHEKYITEALESFVMQKTDFRFEVIVHDDKSTDNTASIIAKYAEQYPDIIKPIYQPENIYSKNIDPYIHYMVPAASGKYVAVCEGDDYWTDSSKLQKQFDYMESHPECSLSAHASIIVFEDGRFRSNYSNYEERDFDIKDVLNDIEMFHTSSMFFKTDFFTRNTEYLKDTKLLFDFETKILLAAEGYVHYLSNVMSARRLFSIGSWTVLNLFDDDKSIQHFHHAINVYNRINEYLNFKYNDLFEKAILRREYNILIKKRDYEALKREPYKSLIKEFDFKRKIKFYIRRYTPGLYPILRKINKKV